MVKHLQRYTISFYKPLCAYSKTIIGCTNTVQDIVRDVFLELLKNRKDIQVKSLKEYLFRSVRNRCLKHMVHLHVMRKYGEHVRSTTEESDTGNEPMLILTMAEKQSELEQAIAALPEKYKQIIFTHAYRFRSAG